MQRVRRNLAVIESNVGMIQVHRSGIRCIIYAEQALYSMYTRLLSCSHQANANLVLPNTPQSAIAKLNKTEARSKIST